LASDIRKNCSSITTASAGICGVGSLNSEEDFSESASVLKSEQPLNANEKLAIIENSERRCIRPVLMPVENWSATGAESTALVFELIFATLLPYNYSVCHEWDSDREMHLYKR
jgi:hypothetical protein